MEKTLSGKNAIVTGGSKGIGRAICLRLAEAGANVAFAARDLPSLQRVSAEVQQLGITPLACKLDLRSPSAARELVTLVIEKFGAIDILINNAGATVRGPFLNLREADWQDGFALKFFGAVRLTQEAWPSLKTCGGSVINIVGVGGRTPGAEFAIGGSVNAALLSLTKALTDLGIDDGVQVNAVNPGFVRTDRLKVRLQTVADQNRISLEAAAAQIVKDAKVSRLGEPEDIANLVAYIVSPEGRFIHGALIDIDGGQTKTI